MHTINYYFMIIRYNYVNFNLSYFLIYEQLSIGIIIIKENIEKAFK